MLNMERYRTREHYMNEMYERYKKRLHRRKAVLQTEHTTNLHYHRKPPKGQHSHWNKDAAKQINLKNKHEVLRHIALPGVEKILTNSDVRIRILWVIAVTIFYALCIYQFSDRISVYFERPITLQQNIQYYKSVEFPSVTVCPSLSSRLWLKICRNYTEGTQKECRFSDFNTTLDKIWNYFMINQSHISTEISCTKDRESKGCNKKTVPLQSTLPTYFGTCITLTIVNNITYRGAETLFSVNVKDDRHHTVEFVLHPKHIVPIHEATKRHKAVPKGYRADVRFQYKEINFLNTRQNPCVQRSKSVECTNNCLNKYLDEKVTCRLPFMINSSLKLCETHTETVKSISSIKDAYMEHNGCNCPRSCRETLIEYGFDSYVTKDPYTVSFKIRFPNNIVEVVTESYRYTITSLLSDLGGSLGFCVGLCLFSFVEMAEYIFRRLGMW